MLAYLYFALRLCCLATWSAHCIQQNNGKSGTFPYILGDEDWKRLTIKNIVCIYVGIFNGLKGIQTPHILFRISEQIKPLQLVGRAAEFMFEPNFEPVLVIWQSLPWAVPEDNRRFSLQNQWLSSWRRALAQQWQEQTQGVSKLAVVAAGSNQFAWGKGATTLAILTCSRVKEFLMVCKFHAVTIHWRQIFFSFSIKSARTCHQPK